MTFKAVIKRASNVALSSAILCAVVFSMQTQADSHPSDQLIERSASETNQLLRDQQQRAQKRAPTEPAKQTIEAASLQTGALRAGGPCFDIHSTVLLDSSNLLPTPIDYQQLNGQCADKKALVELVERLNIFYQQAGLITTRVYLQAQNLKSGELTLVAKAGLLERFKLADGKPVDRRISSAYPFAQGELINLRDMEQGLENLNRLPSQSAKTQLQPGSELGLSNLVIKAQNTKPWRVNANLNNHGSKSTGTRLASVDFGYDNLLNLNDMLSVYYQQNTNPNSAKKRNRNLSFNYVVPYKKWLFKFAASRYTYQRIIQGVNQSYNIDGYSSSRRLSVDYLLGRNQQSRWYATSSLSTKKSHNFIEDTEIQSQYRRLTLLDLGLRGDHQFANKNFLDWSFSVTKNLHELNAMHVIPGLSEDHFNYLRANLKFDIPIRDNQFTYSTTLALQYSDNELPGTEQFSVGGMGSVRGFHGQSIYGNTGAYWRNSLSSKAKTFGDWTIKPSISLDVGAVKSPASIKWSQSKVAGIGMGLQATYKKKLSINLNVSRAIDRPSQLTGGKNQAFFSINYAF